MKKHLVSIDNLSNIEPGCSVFDLFPDSLKAKELKEFINHIQTAKLNKKPVHLMMGAHVIKTGLSPIIIDLCDKGYITSISMNGACLIHELELGFYGTTSEDVKKELEIGKFGINQETFELYSSVIRYCINYSFINSPYTSYTQQYTNYINNLGEMAKLKLLFSPNKNKTILGSVKVPVFIHVAIGTDIVSQMDDFDAGTLGAASHKDFLSFSKILEEANDGGVVINLGSAVMLPEVFLKALNLARKNLKEKCNNNIITANFDMIYHYRPKVNVVERPGPNGYNFIGHHEIMLPLLYWGLINEK